MTTVTPNSTVLSLAARSVDETRSLTQHDYREDPLKPSRGFFHGVLCGAVLWSVIIAVAVWWVL